MLLTEHATTKCPHRPDCDGCPAFEVDPQTSYAEKVADVRGALGLYALHGWPEPTVAVQGRTLGYRNRARMMVRADGRLGLYRAGTREVVPIDGCLVHEPAVEAVLDKVRESGLTGSARNVDVRANRRGEAIVTLGFAEEPSDEDLARMLHLASPTLSVHVDIGTSAAFLTGEHRVVEGADALNMQVAGRTFEVPPAAFFQVNTEVLERIHEVLRPFVAGSEVIWDLYCGVGVHGLACAAPGQIVRGFDIDEDGIAAARRNAAQQGIDATYVAASDADFVPPQRGGRAIVNPARAGLAWSLPAQLGGKVARLAYISCEPTTFLRDAERLTNEGFALREIHTFDMMPRTSHIELVGLFEAADLPRRWTDLGQGITGAPDGPGEQTWVALVDGVVPRHATLPGGEITLERLRAIDGGAVVKLQAPAGTDAAGLLGLLKHWRHPVLGDERGNRAANFRWKQAVHLDVPALHRLRCGEEHAPVPEFLLTAFRLPRKVVQR
jgi:23S rRNA (uracil1939-C5)-methyltransferase